MKRTSLLSLGKRVVEGRNLGAGSLLGASTFGALALVAGCQQEQPINPEALAQQASENIGAIFESAALSAQANPGAERAGSRIGSGVGTISGSFGNVPVGEDKGGGSPTPYIRQRSVVERTLLSVPALRATLRPLATPSLLGPSRVGDALYATATEPAEGTELASDLDDTGAALRRLMRERIFAAANLESKTDSEAIYLLRPDPTCRDLDSDEIDKSCADNLTKVPLRVRLSKEGGGSSMEFLVGSERARPARLLIEPTRIALDLYLGDLKRTSAILAKALGQSDDSPDGLSGTVRFALAKEGPKAASFSGAILQMVEVEQKSGSSPGRFRSAAADPIYKLTADGDKGTITGAVGLGATEFFAPWTPKEVAPGTPSNTDLHVTMAGLTGEITFTQASEDVKLTRVGYGPGPLTVEVRGQRIFQMDLNAQHGRAYDLAVTFDAQGSPRLAFTPRFDLDMAFKFAAVAGDFNSPPPAFLLDETYQFALDPAAGANPVITPWKSASQEGLRVAAGQLSIGSSKAGTPVVVSAGQCLVSAQATPEQHPVIGAFKAVDCP
jgi:hypothetical protein